MFYYSAAKIEQQMKLKNYRHELAVIVSYLLVGFSTISAGLWALIAVGEPVVVTSILSLTSGVVFLHCLVQSHERLHRLAIANTDLPSRISYSHIGPFVTNGHCEIKTSLFWQTSREQQTAFLLAPALQWVIAVPFVLGTAVVVGLSASGVLILLLLVIPITGPSSSDVEKARKIINEGAPVDDLRHLGRHEFAEGIA
jgi:hypothetical protein